MNEPLSFSELLSAFIDNELDGAQSSTLFYMLAQNQDLQTEMRHMLMMRNAMRTPMLIPPDRLKENILQRVGLESPGNPASSTPTTPAAVVKSSPGFLHNPLFLVTGSGLIAAAVTALLLLFVLPLQNNSDGQNTAAKVRVERHESTTAAAARKHSTAEKGTGADTVGSAVPPGGGEHTMAGGFESRDGEPLQAVRNNPPRRGALAEEYLRRTAADRALRLQELQQSQPPRRKFSPLTDDDAANEAVSTTITEAPEESHELQQQIELANVRSIDVTETPLDAKVSDLNVIEHEFLPEIKTPEMIDESRKDFSLRMRGFNSRSYPEFDLPSLVNPPVNNIAVGLFYDLSENSTIGIEGGQENFLQSYSGIDSMYTTLFYEQNYLALWGGAVYRQTLGNVSWLGNLRPFVELLAGGVESGPLARSTAGIEYRLGTISLMAGAEGTVLLYRFQQQWFTTRKLGITYGMEINF